MIRHNLIQDSLVYALVMTAEKDQVLFLCQLARHGLIENLALRCDVDDSWFLLHGGGDRRRAERRGRRISEL